MASEDIVYGPHAVKDAIEAGRAKRLWILESDDKGRASQFREEIARSAIDKGIRVDRVARNYLDSRMGRSNHQGIIAQVMEFPYTDFSDWLSENLQRENLLVVMLDGVQDPGNLGNILRQCAGFNVDLVIIPERRACAVTPTVEKTSAGYASKVNIAVVGNLVKTLEVLKGSGLWSYALDMAGKTSLIEVEFPPKAVLVLGGEHEGISRLLLKKCDETVSIPMPGPIESFNVATSSALALYEFRRQYS